MHELFGIPTGSLAAVLALGFLSGKIQTLFSDAGSTLPGYPVGHGPGSPPSHGKSDDGRATGAAVVRNQAAFPLRACGNESATNEIAGLAVLSSE